VKRGRSDWTGYRRKAVSGSRACVRRRTLTAFAVAAAALAVAGCSVVHREPATAQPDAGRLGTASWYGPGFQGRRTASGERFDQHAFTAAARSFPLGTRLRVTNLANGRSAVVRVNDRGPFVHDRVLDVSYASARALDMIGRGTARVRIEPVDAVSSTSPVRRRRHSSRRAVRSSHATRRRRTASTQRQPAVPRAGDARGLVDYSPRQTAQVPPPSSAVPSAAAHSDDRSP
jgi:rare lipoprotein A